MTGPRRRPPAWAILAAAPLLAGWSFFDPFHAHVEKGNARAGDGDAETAVQEYDEAAKVDPSSPIPDFNKGVALARKGDAAAARDALLAAAASRDAGIAADALYNLGNVQLAEKSYGEAVESYLKSLDLDPADPDARRNLEIALRRLQEQPPQAQPEPSPDGQDQDPPQDEQQQPEPQDPNQGPEPPEEPQPEPSPEDSTQAPEEERMSREDAQRLLNAIRSDELKVLDKLQDREPVVEGGTNDW